MQTTFIQKFLTQVSNKKHKPAIVFNGKNITYNEVNLYSDAIATYILKSDISSQKIVPLILERDISVIISMIGVLKSGCAFLPISPITPCSRIRFILEDTKSNFVISNINLQHILDNNRIINPNDIIKLNSSPLDPIFIDDSAIAYVMYTSGSTGNPKGVQIKHNSMMNLFDSLIENLNISSDDKFLALTDYTFDISLIELLLPLIQGATIILTEQGTVADGNKIKQYLDENTISIMQATPLTWEILLKQGWKNNNTKMQVLVGGEKFKTSLAESLNYKHGNVWNMYGPTETSMWSMANNLSTEILTETVPLGAPLQNTFIKILDSEFNEVGKNTQGELFIGGLGLAKGYLNNQKLTDEKFIYHPQIKERLYKTGDLVVDFDNQGICYIGRSDDQLKFGGIRIEAGEIESCIEQEPFVKKAIIKMHEKEEYYKTLAAYIEIDEEKLFSNDISAINHKYAEFIKNIYNETYLLAEKYEQGNINNCGWQSSFTGKLFSPDELFESTQFIKNQIMQSDLSSILEVGCGTGALLLDYINHAKKCTIVEISIKAIEYISKKLTKDQQQKITYINESIVNVHSHDNYSCIIVNSVLQYLPSVAILISTIKQLVSSAKSGGTIILGDIRSLELMDLYVLEKIRQNNHEVEDLNQHINTFYYKSRDTEITLSPQFFYILQKDITEISYIDINVKNGIYENELNYFRYDVIIHVKKIIELVPTLFIEYKDILTKEHIYNLADNNPKNAIKIKNIPNIYTKKIINKIFDGIKDINIDYIKLQSIEENVALKELLSKNFKLSTHDIYLNYNFDNPNTDLDILLQPKNKGNLIRSCLPEISKPIKNYFREPFNPWIQQFCFEHIKLKITENILSWVMPSVYIWIEKWPISINGKLDKKKLMLPLNSTNLKKDSKTIGRLQNIWRNITGDDILLDKEFWIHGVSSLSMYFFLANINEVFLINISYHEFREHNTLKKLAKHIEKLLDLK